MAGPCPQPGCRPQPAPTLLQPVQHEADGQVLCWYCCKQVHVYSMHMCMYLMLLQGLSLASGVSQCALIPEYGNCALLIPKTATQQMPCKTTKHS